MYKDILAVLSVQHQTIHIFQILDGMFINVRTIGRYIEHKIHLNVIIINNLIKNINTNNINTLGFAWRTMHI